MHKKKIIVGAVAIAMLLPLLTLAATQGKSGKLKLAKSTNVNTAELEASGFEHIPAPWAVSSFDNVKQVGDGLWGKRKGGSDKKDKPSVGGKMSSAGLACLSTAMDTANAAAIAAIATRDEADHSAMSARNACLKTALASAGTDTLQQMKDCNKTYMDARMASGKTAEDAIKAAQTQYLADGKACVTANPATDTSSLDADAYFMATMVPRPEQGQQGKPSGSDMPPQGGKSSDSNKGLGTDKTMMMKPPQEATDACASLAQDAACSFTRTNNGEKVTGTCAMPPGATALACKPAGMRTDGGQHEQSGATEQHQGGTPTPGTQQPPKPPQPPQEALDACASLAQDAACSFTRSNNNEKVTGSCATLPGGTALACKPAGMMMPHAEVPKN
jgi:hypothetical protein